jgi:hypothetical protein
MSNYVPAIAWVNGRAGGTRLNAQNILAELDNLGDYVETMAGGALSIVSPGTVTTNQTLNMNGRQECLWILTLGANIKIDIIGMAAGDSVTLVIKQDAVGGRLVAQLPTAKWDDGVIPGTTTTPNAIDIRGFFSDGVNVYGFDSGTGMA